MGELDRELELRQLELEQRKAATADLEAQIVLLAQEVDRLQKAAELKNELGQVDASSSEVTAIREVDTAQQKQFIGVGAVANRDATIERVQGAWKGSAEALMLPET